MARFITLVLALVAVALAGFALWMRSGTDAAALSEAEIEAARTSGSGARAIELEAEDESRALPTLSVLREMVDRAALAEELVRIQASLAGAAGEERGLLTVLLAEGNRMNGDLDRAFELAETGVELLPGNSQAHFILAETIMSRVVREAETGGVSAMVSALDDVKRYQSELAAAVALDPANVDARVRQIIVYAFGPWPIGSKKKARGLIEELGEFDAFRRDFWKVQLLVGDDDRIDEALAGFRGLQAARPDDPDVIYNIGELLAKKDEWTAAAAEFDRLVEVPRTQRAFQSMYQAAKARSSGGFELERALSDLEEYEAARPLGDLMPSLARVAYHRGNVLAKLGRPEEARAAYERSLELEPDRERVQQALEALGTGD